MPIPVVPRYERMKSGLDEWVEVIQGVRIRFFRIRPGFWNRHFLHLLRPWLTDVRKIRFTSTQIWPLYFGLLGITFYQHSRSAGPGYLPTLPRSEGLHCLSASQALCHSRLYRLRWDLPSLAIPVSQNEKFHLHRAGCPWSTWKRTLQILSSRLLSLSASIQPLFVI